MAFRFLEREKSFTFFSGAFQSASNESLSNPLRIGQHQSQFNQRDFRHSLKSNSKQIEMQQQNLIIYFWLKCEIIHSEQRIIPLALEVYECPNGTSGRDRAAIVEMFKSPNRMPMSSVMRCIWSSNGSGLIYPSCSASPPFAARGNLSSTLINVSAQLAMAMGRGYFNWSRPSAPTSKTTTN